MGTLSVDRIEPLTQAGRTHWLGQAYFHATQTQYPLNISRSIGISSVTRRNLTDEYNITNAYWQVGFSTIMPTPYYAVTTGGGRIGASTGTGSTNEIAVDYGIRKMRSTSIYIAHFDNDASASNETPDHSTVVFYHNGEI